MGAGARAKNAENAVASEPLATGQKRASEELEVPWYCALSAQSDSSPRIPLQASGPELGACCDRNGYSRVRMQ